MKNKKINSKKNYKSILKKSSVLLGAMALSFGIIALNFKGENPTFSKYRDHYNSDLAYIKESTIPSDTKFITMTQAANGARPVISDNPELSQKISISTFDELIKFSTLLNDDDSYLAYDYALIANIQCDGSHDFVPVGYKTNKAFSGTFDGQGYEILDLQLSGNIPSEMVYYGMFSVNSGTITNVGLTDPILTISSPTDNLKGAGGVAYLCGYNTGTISNSFVVDDSTEQNVAGITAYDCRIADLCVKNSGSLTDDYVAVDVVVNQQSTSAEYAEIVLNNAGSMNRCYYYNNSISMISGSRIIYKDSYNLKDKTTLPAGTNKTKRDLINTLNTDGWYTSSSYGDLSTYVPISYGVRRGLSYTNSTKTFTITNPKDYAYMYELFNLDDYMASDKITYQITGDINLGVLPVESYTYTKSIGASIIGATNVANSKTKLITNNATTYPTIYNAKILDKSRMTKSVGVDCYGLFNFVTGKIKNLNVYATGLNLNDIKQNNENVKGIGVLAGYVEQGIIENVNVYAEFTNVTDSNHETEIDLGEYYLGGITGILGGAGVISNSSANGSMNLVSRSNTISESQYMSGIAIGGIVGYIESSLGNVSNSTSAVDITSMLGTSTSYAIGGVIGAGYTTNYNYVENDLNQSVKTSNLENVGDITVGDSSNNTYSSLYVAGIIGRHLGVTAQVEGFNNVGKINVYANGNTTYVSGCENADILSSSQFKNNAGQPLFYASAFTNGEIITIAGSSTNLQYTNVLNLNAGNGIVSKLEGIFNLAYNEKYDETSSTTNLTKTSTAIAAQEISMNFIKQFAPVLNVIGGTSVYKTEANMVYNLRDINYTLSTAISSATTFNYTGVALGDYITYNDVRNEGNLTVTFNAGISTASTLKVSGIFDTLNLGCTANNLYNGGNITINESNGSSANKKIDMYLSGICYQNASVDDSQLQNPLNANFDESLLGTLSNVINNGDITVESDYLEKDVNINSTPSTTPHFISNIYVGGITYLNNGIISDAFNLGNVNVAVYTLSGNTGKYYEAGGITCVMDGEYAQIRDAANNGDLYVVDITNKSYKSTVNIGGIIARNCQLNRTTSAGNNNKQVVAFTINYGTLNAFQSANNMSNDSVTVENCHSSAGGILGTGICNLVDIVNYGNVYGNECTAGIVALVRLGTYNDSNTINLANTINYGQVKINPQYYAILGNNTVYQTYNTLISLDYIEIGNVTTKRTYAGSISSIFDFNGKSNTNIRFLINLFNQAKTVLYNLNTPTSKPDVSTFITSSSTSDTFGDNPIYIKYAPLTTIEDEYGNIGAFSSRFVFRRAINKDSEIYQPSTYTTDKYIPEFFQFVVFDKVNSSLLQSIGWETIAYQSAAEQLVKNVGALATLINVSNTTNLLSDAFESNTWLSTIDDELFNSLLNESLECGELSDNITDILDYVLFDSTATSSYTTEIRTKIVEKILKYYEKQGSNDYYAILQSMLYDTLLAKVVSNDDTNYAAVKTEIETILKDSDLSAVFDAYIELLTTDVNGTILSSLFDSTSGIYYENSKVALLNVLLNGYDEFTLEKLYNELDTTSGLSIALQYKLYLENNLNEAKDIYIKMIEFNSLSTNSSYLATINSILNKYNFNNLIEEQSDDETYGLDRADVDDIFNKIADISGYKYTELNGQKGDFTQKMNTDASQLKTIQSFKAKDITSLKITPTYDYSNLWNVIKNDSRIQNYISQNYFVNFQNPTSGRIDSGIVAHATEWNNTYQTNDRSQLSYNIPLDYKSGICINDDYYGGGQANYTGDTSNKYSANLPARTRFIYTPDEVVSYRTNYYGPYTDAITTYTGNNGGTSVTLTGVPYDAGGNLTANNRNYYLGTALNAVDSAQGTTDTTRRFVPFFISLNASITSQKIAEANPIVNDTTLYQFLFHDRKSSGSSWGADLHWKDYQFAYDPARGDGTDGFMYYYYYDNNGNPKNAYDTLDSNHDYSDYIVDGYCFNPEFIPSVNRDWNGIVNCDSSYNGITINGVQLTNLVNKTGANHTYKDYYLKGYATASILTGVYITYSTMSAVGDETGSNNVYVSLHAKHDTKNAGWNLKFGDNFEDAYFGIHTTSFIGYTLKDLLKLDGIKTKGLCNGQLDEDEINIVSAICTKLISDNKELVLKAIANYSSNHTFNSTNSDVLNFLLTTITDTDFATNFIINNVSNILTLKYSNSLTIQNRLNTLVDSSNLNYKDLLILNSVNHRPNYRKLLLLLLTEYSQKCKEYENYNNYIRDALSNYLYKYISYRYSQNNNLDWDDFDNWINALNDSDLSNINDLFDLTRDHLYLNNYNYIDEYSNTVFTINDSTYYTSLYSAYDSLYDTNYDGVLVGETDFDGSTTGSNISFTTGDWQYGYDLLIIYKSPNNGGKIYLDNSSNYNEAIGYIDEAEYTSISANTIHTIYFDEDVEIYKIDILSHEYESPIFNATQATAPFASVSSYTNISGGVNFELQAGNGNKDKNTLAGTYYRMYLKAKKESRSIMNINISKGTNVTLNELKITFIISVREGYTELDIINKFNDNEITFAPTLLGTFVLREQGSNVNYNATKYEITIPLASINASNTYSIDIHYKVPNNYETSVMISSMCFDYDFDYNNGTNGNITNVEFHQDLFSPYFDNTNNGNWSSTNDVINGYKKVFRSYLNLTNNNSDCYVNITSENNYDTGTIQFPQTNYLVESANFNYKISSQPNISPTYRNQSYEQGEEFYLSFPIEDIDISLTLVDRLKNNYYNLLSDVGKYVIKDYFVKQTSNSQFVTNGVNSYVEFYATGSGTITIYDENTAVVETINVATESGVYNWFEYIASNNYTYEVSPGVTIDSVYVSPVGTTMSYTTDNTTDILVANSSDTLINLDYSELKTRYNANKTISEDKIETYSLSYEENELFYLVFPYYRNVTGKTNEELYEIDVYNTIITLMGTIKPKYNINGSYVNNLYNPKSDTNEKYYTLFAHSDFDEDDWIALINKIALADYKGTNSALYKLVKGLDSQYYLNLLKDLCSEQGLDAVKYNTVTAVYNYASTHLSSQLALYIYAAYLGDNYLDNSNLLKSTIMYTILNNFSNGDYQFITSNTTVDSAKVTALINYLSNNSNINIDGYGIFALSSSHGIGYGIFIPDNMDLSKLDVYYEESIFNASPTYYVKVDNNYVSASGAYDSNTTYYVKNGDSYSSVTIDAEEYDASRKVIVLLDATNQTKSSKWRGGDNISSGAIGTVDYAFYHDMKQLILSISTDVFELDFDNSIYSADDQINNATGEIIYYLSYPDFGTLYNKTSVTISYKSLANNAKLATIDSTSTNVVDATTISLTGDNVTRTPNTSIIVKNAFKVFAEDRSVSKNYTIKFIAAAPNSITLTLDPTSIGYNGGTITANVSGTDFPEGMDLEPYIRIIIGSTTYSSEDGYWMLDPEYINNAVVKNNTATIKVIIDKSLPGNDNITFRLAILGTNVDATFSKTENTENYITDFEFEGKPITIADSMSSNILFGRAFNYTDLTAIYIKTTDTSVNTSKIYYVKTGDDAFAYKKVLNPVTADINTYYEKNADFYLNNFVCSVNAKVNITATKSTDAHGLMSYVVTFSVTSEFGSTRTYTHTLKEKNYFDNSTYAYLYADGERVTSITKEAYSALSEADRVKYLSDGTFTYTFNDDDFNGSASSSLADDLFMQVSFNRAKDREPQYRVKYTLSNFYTLGENVVFGPTTATSNNGATVNNTYAGLTVTVSNNNNTGKYVFVYSYTNKGIWENNTEYTRYYEFPELIVEKLASTDALLRKITFLEEAVSLGNTSTVILPNQVLVPTYEDQTVGYLSDDELYNDIFNSTSRKINVAHSGIQYGDYDAPQYTDYFAIGTVSNADLSYYCPTFAIEEHAQMYQYTTYLKLTEYGSGVQTKKDKVILTNHSASNNMYLYVPYTNGTVNEIFLVELTAAGYWTNVYRTTFNGKNADATVDGKAVTVGTYNVSDKVTANNCLDAPLVAGYRVCDYAGQPTNNNSLFMDYVGTPLEGHFWYVSYVVFSEDKLEGGNLEGNVRYYHISIIDVTNNIQFYVKVYAPTSLNKKNLYLTISENIYDKSDKTLKTDTRQLSAYAVYSNTTYSGTRTDIAGYKIYNTQYDLQTLPSGYFYFHIDLPDGYVAKAYTSMKNQLIKYKQDGETIDEQASGNYTAEPGSFLPYSAIITQKVYLEIVVTEGTGSNSSAWAVATSDIYTRDATYDGLIPTETQN